MGAFEAELFRIDGPGGWHFVRIPETEAPDESGPWGRSPVVATVNGQTWRTSAWKDTKHGWLLAVPRRIRGEGEAGDVMTVAIDPDNTRH